MTPEQYRQRASQCLQVAETFSDSKARLSMVNMAAAWLRLADQAEKNSTTESCESPPVRPTSDSTESLPEP